jgi:hypothetical protein
MSRSIGAVALPRGGRTKNGTWSSDSPTGAGGVHAAAHLLGHRELEVRLPPAVVEVVVVEVYGAVLLRRVDEVLFEPLPVPAGHRPRRLVDARAVQPRTGDVADAVGGDAVPTDSFREVPPGEQARRVGLLSARERGQLILRQRRP